MHSTSQAALVVLAFSVFILFYRKYLLRSSLNKIPGPPNGSIFTGNFLQLFGAEAIQFHERIPDRYGSVAKIWGLLWDKQLYVTDPLALYHIVVKDQYIFEETDVFIKLNKIVFGESLLSSLGTAHAKQRKFLNPVFSIGHMRNLLPTFNRVMIQFRDLVSDRLGSGPAELDMMDWCSRAALEFIGQAGLGYSFDAFDENKPNPYRDSMKSFGPTLFRLVFVRLFLPYVCEIGPAWLRRFFVDITPNRDVQRLKKLVDIMDQTSRDIWAEKKVAFERGMQDDLVGGGKDIMSLMLQASVKSDENKLSEDELIGQMTTLIFAGHDTTSSALARVFYLLAHQQDVQSTLREEVQEALAMNPEFDYESLMGLPYLDAICRETLRLYAPVNHLARTCRKGTVVPLSNLIHATDGSMIQELYVPKGTNLFVGIGGANKSKAIWGPDAMEWRPERWLDAENATHVADVKLPGVYSSMMTFLGGGRACIGFKFSLMELKLVLATLVASFKFSPSSQDDDILWRMGGIRKPFLRKQGFLTPRLPLKVEAV